MRISLFGGFVSVVTLFDCGGEGIAFETRSVDPCCRLNQVFISVPDSKEVGLRFYRVRR